METTYIWLINYRRRRGSNQTIRNRVLAVGFRSRRRNKVLWTAIPKGDCYGAENMFCSKECSGTTLFYVYACMAGWSSVWCHAQVPCIERETTVCVGTGYHWVFIVIPCYTCVRNSIMCDANMKERGDVTYSSFERFWCCVLLCGFISITDYFDIIYKVSNINRNFGINLNITNFL